MQFDGQDRVPLTVRLPVLQSDSVRVWVRVSLLHAVSRSGDQALTVHVLGQDLLPVAVRLSLLQSARVRVWVKLWPAQTVVVAGAHALIEHFFPGGCSGLQGPLSMVRARV